MWALQEHSACKLSPQKFQEYAVNISSLLDKLFFSHLHPCDSPKASVWNMTDVESKVRKGKVWGRKVLKKKNCQCLPA